jgi:hypothetical protein
VTVGLRDWIMNPPGIGQHLSRRGQFRPHGVMP